MITYDPGCVKTRLPTIDVKSLIAAEFAEERMIQSGALRSNEMARCRYGPSFFTQPRPKADMRRHLKCIGALSCGVLALRKRKFHGDRGSNILLALNRK